MGIENLDRIFHPRSIAVVGASERQGSLGDVLMRNLIECGFSGALHPIHPRHKIIHGRPARAAITDLDPGVDLAVLAVPIDQVPGIIKGCAAVGVGGAVIISAGGKEIGEDGRQMEKAIQDAAGASGLRIVGPNCVGILCSSARLSASFAVQMPRPGKIAFLSQSGAICTAVLDLSIKEHMGFSHFVNLGDMLDVDFGDMIDYLAGERDVASILMYVENLTHFRKFMSAARAVSRVKPIIALKAGRTRAGALAASSHTGALAGEDAVYDAAFQRAGILRVKTFEELFDCAELLAKQPRPKGPGLAIITNAGGLGVMAVDALSDYGHEPARLREDTLEKLNAELPPFWSKRNPIDMLGDATTEQFCRVVDICLKAGEIDGLLIMTAPQAMTESSAVAAALIDRLRGSFRPVITAWVGGAYMQEGRDIFNRAGIATFDTPERAVRAFINIYRHGRNSQVLQQIPSRLNSRLEFDCRAARRMVAEKLTAGSLMLSEPDAKILLALYGIPVNSAHKAATREAAQKIADDLGFPVVMKINSRDIFHKSEARCVCLDLNNQTQVGEAYDLIRSNAERYNPVAAVEGVSIQPMLGRADYELILGARKDRDFGPVVLFGMGGIYTEVLADRAIAFPPLNRLLARRLMQQTRVYRLLEGYRGTPPADLEGLETLLIRLAQLVTDIAEIEEIDINPLFVKGDTLCALDARVLLKPAALPGPLHLVISPYPAQDETHLKTAAGVDIFVRPIRPEDAPLLEAFFDSLSPRSVYLRFYTPLKSLPPYMLARFTQIDYDREIALVALPEAHADETLLGVARVINEANQKRAEFSVVVGDAWQGKGIGAALLKRCLDIAGERGLENVWGLVLAGNTQMLALGRKMGFTLKKVPDAGEYELIMDLKR